MANPDVYRTPFFSYKHPPNAVGNVMSISAIAGYNGRLYYGDYTQSKIASLDDNGQNERLELLDCYPVGLYPR